MKKFFNNLFKKNQIEDLVEDDSVLLSAIALLLEVSLADEIMDISEVETLKDVLLKEFDVDQTKIDDLISNAKKNQNSSTSLYEFTRKINDDYKFEDKKNLILSMWKIAFADGNIDKYEEYVIRKVSDLIYISHPDFIESKQLAREEYENRKT
ncbi:MAG: hypothetical protein CBD82_01200 [Gammaproteobacteria bacterium TMED222]|jgi:uncharacterized tellurite resistance protein B-like protein|nr:MAG: hypothetical protein CBD82_01200 [Gammaproteobacteria bacterium TMED222]RZP00904.1 MAG: TerB family tellurite resistance protein [Gammaproteobacteria bacterium]|tara:strand:- start:7394 stop:7852 length:459 start_codon:yes stop_codon:yes gene_type:complete